MTNSDKKHLMNVAALECSIAESIKIDDLLIKYNKEKDEYRIVNTITKQIMFKKVFK